jgi:hypothetical protein
MLDNFSFYYETLKFGAMVRKAAKAFIVDSLVHLACMKKPVLFQLDRELHKNSWL